MMDLREFHQQIDRLYRVGGVPQVDSALALWYLKKASTASDHRTIDGYLKKAHMLDPAQTPFWLAELHRRKNRFDEAAKCYMQAFSGNSDNSAYRAEIGDFLLRYGTSDQVVEFYSQVASIDPADETARFVLDCYAYFEQLKQEIGTRILCAHHQNRHADRLLMQVVFWGPRYTDIFLNYLLPALCAPGNLPAVVSERQVDFVICTDKQGRQRLRQHPWFSEIQKYCCPHIITFSESLFEYATGVSNRADGHWTMPQTLLTNAAHYAGLECGRLLRSDVLNFSPDHILSDHFMTAMQSALTGDIQALSGPGFRLYYGQTLLKEIESKYRGPQGNLEIPPQEMVRLLNKYLPKPNFVHAEQFSAYPIYLCWRVEDEGVIAHVNHYHPWVVCGHGLKGAVQLSLDPIDGNFLNRSLSNQQAVAFAPNAMLSFDLGNNPLCLPADNGRFNPKQVAQWVQPYLTPVHEQYFKNSLYYMMDEGAPSANWNKTAHRAATVVQEIIQDAKPA
jgi:hypothetical protein